MNARYSLRLVLTLVWFTALSPAALWPGEKKVAPPAELAAVIEQLDSAIHYELDDKQIPSLAIVLVDRERVLYAAGFGKASEDPPREAHADTVYRVGSISKLMTDLAVMREVEAGRLSLDAPLSTYLPELQPGNRFEKPLTLRQLMTHRAGLVREPPRGNYFDAEPPTLRETVLTLNETELVYEPETRTKYSNAGIGVVGYVLEKQAGIPFEELIQQRVLEPCGMATATFAPGDELGGLLADGWMWTYDGRRFKAPTFLLGTSAAGNLYASANDLGAFMRAMLLTASGDRSDVISRDGLESMWQPQFTDADTGFGLGFFCSRFHEYRQVGHGGAVYGHSTSLAILPDAGLGVAAAVSIDVHNGVVDHLVQYALDLLLAVREQRPLPDYERAAPLPPERAARLAGAYRHEDGRVVQLRQRGDRLLLDGRTVRESLRMLGERIVADDFDGLRGTFEVSENELRIGADVYQRLDPTLRPAEPPEHWKGLIGEYGWDHNTLYILEHYGRLYALIEWFFYYPLSEVDASTYRFPDYGLYHGESLIFARDEQGKATEVIAASVKFPRRAVGPEDGATFRIVPRRSVEDLRREALTAHPPSEDGQFLQPDLVEPVALEPSIRLDVRYATRNNFMGEVFYSQPRALLQRPAAEALGRVAHSLQPYGYGLLIHDAYRPWYVTKMFFDATPDDLRLFVANPANGSRHNRGAAVDLTLYDLATGTPARMPSGYDEFSVRAYPDYPGGTTLERWQRELLRRTMHAERFRVYEFEWWHFDFADWKRYPVMNVRFEDLQPN